MVFYRQNLFFCNVLLIWLLLFSLLRTAQHFSFATNAWDLSIFDYAMSSTLKGKIMAEPFHSYGWGSHLAIHFMPILFLLVPLYLVCKGPLFLLYIQVLAVGCAAIPLYLTAKHKLQNGKMALAVALIYLTYRPLLNGLMYDFHPEMFFPLFIFSSYYFLTVKNKKSIFFIFILLALAVKEDFAIYTFFYCLWLVFGTEYRKTALRGLWLSASYTLFTFAIFMPHFRNDINIPQAFELLNKWLDYGRTPLEIFKQAIVQPLRLLKDLNLIVNLGHLCNYFLPLLFIPLWSSAALLILPPLAVGWGSRIPTMASFGLQYGAALIPFLFLGLLLALEHLKKFAKNNHQMARPSWQWLVIAILAINVANFKWNLFAPGKYKFIHENSHIQCCLALIPEKASVAAQSAIIPHIPKRKAIFMLPMIGQAEYILLHLQLNPWPLQLGQLQELDANLQCSKMYKCLYNSGYLHLYKKNDWETVPNGNDKR